MHLRSSTRLYIDQYIPQEIIQLTDITNDRIEEAPNFSELRSSSTVSLI